MRAAFYVILIIFKNHAYLPCQDRLDAVSVGVGILKIAVNHKRGGVIYRKKIGVIAGFPRLIDGKTDLN